MKAVLSIALTYFSFLPLQRWLSTGGLLLVAASLAVRAVAGAGDAALALSIFGCIMLVLGPLFGGGVVLRQGSSLAALRLRPHGRLRVFLGTTLALTLVAVLVTLPFLVDAPVGAHANLPASAADVFALAWGFMALNWVAVFAASRYQFGLVLLWIIPLVAANLLRFVSPQDLLSPLAALPAGVALWVAFGTWYLRQRRFTPVALMGGSSTIEAAPNLPRFLASGEPPLPRSMPEARQQWLSGGVSLRPSVMAGAGQSLVVLVLLLWLVDQPMGRDKTLLGNLLYMGVQIACFMGGYWLVGRSRVLWLRGGLDRTGLLRHAETTGLLPALIASLSAALVIIVAQTWLRPDLLPTILLNAAAQLVLCACLGYWGLSFTHSWSMEMAIESFGAFMLAMVGNIALGAGRSPLFLLCAIAVLALLALLLRAHAGRRWRQLDWRVKRPQMNKGLAMGGRT